ncbi:MAG: FkbM family methyltransferase [Pseudanabaenaceae cyanobacterium bins.68]|nr:FkbM family methyltransferase [Pseudanabaenaceae cyanobacterium bins.68]
MSLSPLIIAGMHRSGTSLTAAFFQALGISMGEQLYRADAHNPKGYFEDLDFLAFQRQVLQSCCDRDLPGWQDWGWTAPESLDVAKFSQYLPQAKALIASRQQYPNWGWKDPRTTLMLDFWQALLPEAQFLLVYRFPWDVADSILRLQAPIFQEFPHYSLEIWQFYNRQLLDFYRRHQQRCLLVSVNGFLAQTDRFLDLCAAKFALNFSPTTAQSAIAQVYNPLLFGTLDWQHPLVQGMVKTCPQAIALLQELDQAADLASGFDYVASNTHVARELLQLHHQAPGQAGAAQSNLAKNSQYDRQTLAVLEAVLMPTSNCIDVGCHRGDILVEMLKCAPQGQHFAFEPLPEFYQISAARFASFPNVSLFNFALSDSARQTEFLHVVSNPGYSGLQKRVYEGVEQIQPIQVQTAILDHCLPDGMKIDLIKIDVEGAELEVLRGALQTIQRWQPVIIFEHGMGAANCYGTTPEMIFEILAQQGHLQISTMTRFLDGQPALTEQEFYQHFYQGLDYYFIAYALPIAAYREHKSQALSAATAEIERLQLSLAIQGEQIRAMESSKFWRMRQAWFKLKGWMQLKKN